MDSPLLRLPGELRKKIYEYALESPVLRITCDHNRSFNYDYPSLAFVQQRLPQVCRQVHCETKHPVDNFLWISLDGNYCICAWDKALSRQGHDVNSVLEFRLSSTVATEIEEWVDDHDEGFTSHHFPFLYGVICESPQNPDDMTTAIRTLFEKANLEIVHIKGE